MRGNSWQVSEMRTDNLKTVKEAMKAANLALVAY
jgi:hypothetical protein